LAGVEPSVALEPYSAFAADFDESLGDRFFPASRAAFESIERRYCLRYGSVADVGCGTGTFLAYLGDRGVPTLWGVDRSAEMLARAAEKNAGNGARFLRQDLLDIRLPGPVDLLTCQFDTLNYVLTDAELHTVLAGFARAISPGGHALFDVVTARPDLPDGQQRVELAKNARRTVSLSTGYDDERRVQTATLHVVDGAGTCSEDHRQRVHSVAEVIAALPGTGLQLLAAHDFSNLAGPIDHAERVIFLAQRS
jgi:SAM-dependent methyltransferase